MTTFPGSPRLQRGALVGIDPFNPAASVIPFQYNPHTLTRTLQPRMSRSQGQSAKSEVARIEGPPRESFSLDIALDAADALERDDAIARTMGVHPQLAALEMLIYPKSLQVIINTVLMAAGTIEVIPPMAAMTVLIWGRRRVLPVKVDSMTITEEAHGPNLEPIRANVKLGLSILTYADVPLTHPAYGMFLAHQVIKETMATIASLNSVASMAGG